MYVCFKSYYKHGEVDRDIIESDDEMKEYCLEELENYQINTDGFENYKLEYLIELTISEGNKNVEKQCGWGVRYIIKGDNLKEI